MGYMTRAQMQRETGRSRADIDRLFALGLPHEHIGAGKGGEIRVDRSEAMTWLVDLALSTASAERADDAPEIVQQRARLFRLQADG